MFCLTHHWQSPKIETTLHKVNAFTVYSLKLTETQQFTVFIQPVFAAYHSLSQV